MRHTPPIGWKRIHEFPYRQVAHAFVGGAPLCSHGRKWGDKMVPTTPASELDTCATCARRLRERAAA